MNNFTATIVFLQWVDHFGTVGAYLTGGGNCDAGR